MKDVRTEEMVLNMGPQHPSTHGVLRVVIRTDGEMVLESECHIGYLHRCFEKCAENLNYIQVVPYGDGKQTRSFCYVDDLIEAFIRLMDTPDDFTGPVNLGNPGEFTIRELAEKIVAMTGSKSKITFKPLPSDDPMQRCPDITLARSSLGWQPTVDLEKGLMATIRYFEAATNAV